MKEKKIWGVLVGGAVGDAMGMPTECWTYEKICKIYPEGVKELMPSNPDDMFGRDMKAGEVTDDTINTIMIHEMVVKNEGKVNVHDYLNQLIKWNNESGVSQYVSGPSTLRSLEKIANGVPIEKSGVTGTTNGASMRIAPIGIVSDYKDLDTLAEMVYQICLPTHNTKIAVAGASVVAAAISYVINGGNSIDELWELAYQTITKAEKFGYDFPAASLKFRMEAARKIVREEKDEQKILSRIYYELGSGVETIETIPAVFAIIEMADGNPIKAAQLSASIGWDTDTIGAISCAICGGMNPDFPSEMVSTVEEVNQLDFVKLTREILPYSK